VPGSIAPPKLRVLGWATGREKCSYRGLHVLGRDLPIPAVQAKFLDAPFEILNSLAYYSNVLVPGFGLPVGRRTGWPQIWR
jgi:hypothetical protein